MKVAVLGAGKMGVWFAKYFQSKGYSIVVADRKKEKLAKLEKELAVKTADFVDAVKDADQVWICVSINALEEIAKKIGPAIRENQVVLDICSVKEAPVKAMHENIKHGLVLGTHPVFGPGSNGVKHKAFILTPTNKKEQEFAQELKSWLEKEEANVFIMPPEKHDQLMTVVLGLPHFLGVVACETLLEQENFAETKSVAGTTYRMLFTLAEATALETPDLYATLQTSLPDLQKIEDSFLAKAEEWLNLIKKKDNAAIVNRIEKLKSKLMKVDSDFAESYEVMYKMLESTEK